MGSDITAFIEIYNTTTKKWNIYKYDKTWNIVDISNILFVGKIHIQKTYNIPLSEESKNYISKFDCQDEDCLYDCIMEDYLDMLYDAAAYIINDKNNYIYHNIPNSRGIPIDSNLDEECNEYKRFDENKISLFHAFKYTFITLSELNAINWDHIDESKENDIHNLLYKLNKLKHIVNLNDIRVIMCFS